VARSVVDKVGYRGDDTPVNALWQLRPPAAQGELALGDYFRRPDPYYAQVEVMKRSYQAWNKRRISRALPSSSTHSAMIMPTNAMARAPCYSAWIRRPAGGTCR
jgi:hypothetical protein